MNGESNLEKLLKYMDPVLHHDPYVFLTSPDGFSAQEIEKGVMSFKEKEGVTLILEESFAKAYGKEYKNTWAFITLNVHSDLDAVGFLAAITPKLAVAEISVNAVSAFFHDHLFVPWERRHEAMNILKSFQNDNSLSF